MGKQLWQPALMTMALMQLVSTAATAQSIASPAPQPVPSQLGGQTTGGIGSEAASQAPAATALGVEDVIVTAQRIAQPLQRVPVSVQAVGGRELEQRKLSDLVQLQTVVPSLAVGTDNSFSLRGVGSLTFSPNVDSSVGVAVDDVSLGVPLFMNYFGFEDIERVEVLLGPQGLLFGRNASAGLLNIVSARPQFDRVSGHFYAESDYRDTTPGGGWGEIVRGTLNVPVSDHAALRLNGFFSNQDPVAAVVAQAPRARFGNYQRRFGVKGKFLWDLDDRLSLYIIGDYAENRGIGGEFDRTVRFAPPGSQTAIAAARDGIVPGPDNLALGYSAPGGGLNLNTGGASGTLSYKVSDTVTLSNIFAWRAYRGQGLGDIDFTSSDGVDLSDRTGRYRQFSDEFRVTLAPGSFIDGQAGLYWFNSRLRERDFVGAGAYGILNGRFAATFGPADSVTNPSLGLDNNALLNNRSYAAFGQVNIHPVDRLTLIAGGRVTHDDNDISIDQNRRNYPIALGARNYAAFEKVTNTNFSWKLGAQYQATPGAMFYGTYSRGYKGPAFNDTAAVPGVRLAIGPETVGAAEIGAKLTLFDRRLRFNIAGFRQIFNDFQVQGYDAQTQTYFTSNAAKVKSQGVEVFAEAKPVGGLTVSAAATYLDSTFQSYPTDKCYPGQPTCSAIRTSNSTGNRTPSSARFTSTLQAGYERPLTDNATIAFSGSWYHRSSVNFSSNANPRQLLPGIDTLDGSIGTTIDGRFRLAVFCKNCTDKRFPTFIGLATIDPSLLGINSTVQAWGYNSIRTIGISAGFDF